MYKFFDQDQNEYIDIPNLPTFGTLVRLTKDISTIQSLCDMYGSQIYNPDLMSLNPIFECTTYFGRNLDSFEECLRLAPEIINSPIIAVHQSKILLVPHKRNYYYSILKRNSLSLKDILNGSRGFSFCFDSNVK